MINRITPHQLEILSAVFYFVSKCHYHKIFKEAAQEKYGNSDPLINPEMFTLANLEAMIKMNDLLIPLADNHHPFTKIQNHTEHPRNIVKLHLDLNPGEGFWKDYFVKIDNSKNGKSIRHQHKIMMKYPLHSRQAIYHYFDRMCISESEANTFLDLLFGSRSGWMTLQKSELCSWELIKKVNGNAFLTLFATFYLNDDFVV